MVREIVAVYDYNHMSRRFAWTRWPQREPVNGCIPQLKDQAVQALLLMAVYVLTTVFMQFVGFLISRLVHLQFPSTSVMTFLMLFLAAFGIAWPIAVFIAEWLIKRSGREVEVVDARAI